MLTYRARVMLYSSVLALSLVGATDGFCYAEEKGAEANVDQGAGAPPSAETEKAAEELRHATQKQEAFNKRIAEVSNKYEAGFQYVVGEKIDVESQLAEKAKNIRSKLSDFGDLKEKGNTKFEAVEKYSAELLKKVEEKYKFIMHQKESIDEAAWFSEVHAYAIRHLNELKDLRAEFEHNPKEKDSKMDLYSRKIENFIAAYRVVIVCYSYLKQSQAYCHSDKISGHFMTHLDTHFSDRRFTQAADDIKSGSMKPLTVIGDYALYPIDSVVREKSGFSTNIDADSADGKLISMAKKAGLDNENARDQLKANNGGVVLSSKMMLRPGMKAPLCVYSAVGFDDGKESVRRFSLVGKDEPENLTVQFIDAENQHVYKKIEDADKALQAKLLEAKKAEEAKAEAEMKAEAEKHNDHKDHAVVKSHEAKHDDHKVVKHEDAKKEESASAKKRKRDEDSKDQASVDKAAVDKENKEPVKEPAKKGLFGWMGSKEQEAQ